MSEDYSVCLIRVLPLILLEDAINPVYVVTHLVNNMRAHFQPVQDMTALNIHSDGNNLVFMMELV